MIPRMSLETGPEMAPEAALKVGSKGPKTLPKSSYRRTKNARSHKKTLLGHRTEDRGRRERPCDFALKTLHFAESNHSSHTDELSALQSRPNTLPEIFIASPTKIPRLGAVVKITLVPYLVVRSDLYYGRAPICFQKDRQNLNLTLQTKVIATKPVHRDTRSVTLDLLTNVDLRGVGIQAPDIPELTREDVHGLRAVLEKIISYGQIVTFWSETPLIKGTGYAYNAIVLHAIPRQGKGMMVMRPIETFSPSFCRYQNAICYKNPDGERFFLTFQAQIQPRLTNLKLAQTFADSPDPMQLRFVFEVKLYDHSGSPIPNSPDIRCEVIVRTLLVHYLSGDTESSKNGETETASFIAGIISESHCYRPQIYNEVYTPVRTFESVENLLRRFNIVHITQAFVQDTAIEPANLRLVIGQSLPDIGCCFAQFED